MGESPDRVQRRLRSSAAAASGEKRCRRGQSKKSRHGGILRAGGSPCDPSARFIGQTGDFPGNSDFVGQSLTDTLHSLAESARILVVGSQLPRVPINPVKIRGGFLS